MPRPERRLPSRRGGSYSNRPTQNGARPAAGGRRGNGRSGGYGGRAASNGPNQVAIFAGLGGVAVVLVIVLVVLLSAGGGGGTNPVDNSARVDTPEPTPTKVAGGPAPKVLRPFTDAEKLMIREKIEKLDEDYDEAKALKDEGFRCQNAGDLDGAQEAWTEAYDLLNRMSGEAEILLDPFGDDAYDRLERFLPRAYNTIGRWDTLKSEFYKYLK